MINSSVYDHLIIIATMQCIHPYQFEGICLANDYNLYCHLVSEERWLYPKLGLGMSLELTLTYY